MGTCAHAAIWAIRCAIGAGVDQFQHGLAQRIGGQALRTVQPKVSSDMSLAGGTVRACQCGLCLKGYRRIGSTVRQRANVPVSRSPPGRVCRQVPGRACGPGGDAIPIGVARPAWQRSISIACALWRRRYSIGKLLRCTSDQLWRSQRISGPDRVDDSARRSLAGVRMAGRFALLPWLDRLRRSHRTSEVACEDDIDASVSRA
jgi:hypothetical protein